MFDIGGTSIRAGLAREGQPTILSLAQQESAPIASAADPIRALTAALKEVSAPLTSTPSAVVIAVPGPVVNGVVAQLPTLVGGLKLPIDMKGIGMSLWPNARIWICNDLTAAGYELVGQGRKNFCIVTCGSGVGAKIFVEGRPLLGNAGMGGEIGHWRVPGMPPIPCDCGGAGHVGALSSGRGAVNLLQYMAKSDPTAFARSALSELCTAGLMTTSHVVDAFHRNDPWTADALAHSARALGSALALVHLSTATDEFFIMGGFATALGPKWGSLLAQAAADASWDSGLNWNDAITIAEPGIEYGVSGGWHYARHNRPDHTPAEMH